MSTAAITIAHRDDLERTGNWSLVRRSLGITAFGINLVDIPPGEGIPEHNETDRDQEELFVVLSGSALLVIDGERIPAPGRHDGPPRPRAAPHGPQRGRRGRLGADRLGPAHERLRAPGLGVSEADLADRSRRLPRPLAGGAGRAWPRATASPTASWRAASAWAAPRCRGRRSSTTSSAPAWPRPPARPTSTRSRASTTPSKWPTRSPSTATPTAWARCWSGAASPRRGRG